MTEIMVRQSEPVLSLGALADRANSAHREAERLAVRALEHAREAGEALLEAKEQVSHGSWGEWLRDSFEGSPRTAQMYMRVARGWGELEARTQRVAHLSLRQAVGLLGKPRTESGFPDATDAIEVELQTMLAELDQAWEPFANQETPHVAELPELRRIVGLADRAIIRAARLLSGLSGR